MQKQPRVIKKSQATWLSSHELIKFSYKKDADVANRTRQVDLGFKAS